MEKEKWTEKQNEKQALVLPCTTQQAIPNNQSELSQILWNQSTDVH